MNTKKAQTLMRIKLTITLMKGNSNRVKQDKQIKMLNTTNSYVSRHSLLQPQRPPNLHSPITDPLTCCWVFRGQDRLG
jgi:hypothetical protein